MLGLQDALNKIDSCFGFDGDCYIDNDYYSPGFITALTAVMYEKGISEQSFDTFTRSNGISADSRFT